MEPIEQQIEQVNASLKTVGDQLKAHRCTNN